MRYVLFQSIQYTCVQYDRANYVKTLTIQTNIMCSLRFFVEKLVEVLYIYHYIGEVRRC